MNSFVCKQCGESFDAGSAYDRHMAAPHAASGEIGPAELEKAIAQIDFPKSRAELVAYATKQEPMEAAIVKALESLPDRVYKGAGDVAAAFGGRASKQPAQNREVRPS